jgi:hypothetical protein
VDHASPRDLCRVGSRPPHEICHHRPVNSWVTKPGARLSRAGVATRPPPPPSVFPLKDSGPRCQSETHVGTALTTGRLASGG